MLPTSSVLIKNVQRDKDKRGEILSIVDEKIENVSIITCEKGSLRSNHYHHEDFHFMYVLEGEIDYFYQSIKSKITKYIKVKKNDTIFTPNKEIHATFFPILTKLIVSSKNPRDQVTYENDTVRVDFINYDNLNEMLAKYAKV